MRGRLDHRLLKLEVGKAGIGQAGIERDAGGGKEKLARENILEVVRRLVAAE